MKKIGIVSEYFYPHLGGITEHVYYFSKELVRRGFEVVLVTGDPGEEPGVAIPAGLRVIRLGKSTPVFVNNSYAKVTVGWNLGKKVRKILEEERFDLLHIHAPITMTLPLLFQKYTNTLTVGTFHTYFDSVPYYRFLGDPLQRYLDKLHGRIAVAPSCIEALSRYFRSEFKVIPNGVDTAWFSRPAGKVEKYADGSPNILFLGRLDPRNGLENLLKAFHHLERKLPEARLLVVGDGPMRPFFERQAGALLGRKVFFEGQINGNRPDYFATSQVFCYPATKASFGITLLEAMASGTPVVATDNRGFRDIIRDGDNGVLVPPEDPVALADALSRVLGQTDLAGRLAEAGRREAERYSWSRITDQVLQYYDEVSRRVRGVPFAV